MDERDPRTLRLYDLAPQESVIVTCSCGRISEHPYGQLQRQHRVPSDTLIFDLQFRLRCAHCNGRGGFRIAILDRRAVGNSSHFPPERVVVEPKR